MLRIEVQMNLQTFCEQIYPPLPGIARRVAAFDVTALTTYQTRFSRNEQQRQACSSRTIETMYSVHIGFFILRQHSNHFQQPNVILTLARSNPISW